MSKAEEESKSKSTEEKFSLIEPRGEEREEAATPTPRAVDQEERDAGDRSARSPRSPRTPRTPRTPRVEVNGTGREIDDYSSDDDDNDKKNKVISMEGVEAETKPIRRRRSVSSSSSSSDNSDSDGRQQRRSQTNAVISVDLLDKEEREQETARKDKAKHNELRRQEADELLQRQRRENAQRREEERRAEEARRQEDRYEQQQREEARRRREEQRRLEAEQERQQRDEEEESRRRTLLIEQDAQAREEERLRAQRLREEQIMEEQRQREARRRAEERAREERWQEEQAGREERRRKEEEERAERKRQLEEGSSSARTESSTARTSSSEASSSSEESTPRRTGQSELTAHGERERAASPLPPAAVYEDRRQLRGDSAPPPQRPVSPLPPAAVYQERPKRRQETVTAASTQPVPEAAVYRERPRFPATEEPAPIIGLDAQPPSPDEPRKQHTARSSSSATQDSSSSSEEEEEEEEKEESRFQVDQQEYPRFRTLSTRFTDAVAKKPEEDDEASHPNLRYQSKPSDEVSGSEEEEAGAARYQRNQQASKRAEDEDSGTADSSSDSTSSSGGDSDRSITKDSAVDRQHVQDTTEADVSGKNPDSHVRTTSESDGENMHGGADPDNVAQQETVGELLPLRTRELPAAKSHDGKVSELLTSRESVELSNVLLNKTQVYEIASHLEQADTVKMISLCNTGLDDDDMQRLTEAVTASPSEPVMLNLSLNALTQKSVKHVLNVLKAKPSIKLLILQSNPVGDKGAKELVQGLQDLHRQARANRHATATTATADSNTADTLSMDSSASSNIDPVTASRRYLLQELDLTDTGLGDKGAEHVAQLLANNVYVESLGLSHNSRISAQDGWSHIGEALAKNRCLRTLSLDGNRLGDEGVEHLARGLRTNRTLRSLTLEDAGVSVEGGKRLMEMLKRNTTLLELTLSPGNSIPDELAEDIKKYIALNRAPYDNFGV